jgi:hypothetical protein
MMKTMVIILAAILISFNAMAEECPATPDNIKKAIKNHVRKIRAVEYCAARSIEIEGKNAIAVYTAEGACFSDKKSTAGACGNHWERYMVGSINEKTIGPIEVGGKDSFSDSEMKLAGNTVELIGFSIGPNDPLCCPSIPQTKKFEFSQNGFKEIKP